MHRALAMCQAAPCGVGKSFPFSCGRAQHRPASPPAGAASEPWNESLSWKGTTGAPRGVFSMPHADTGLLGGSQHRVGPPAGSEVGVIFKNKQDCSQQSGQWWGPPRESSWRRKASPGDGEG